MATVTKSVSGAVSTFVITDYAGNTLTLACNAGPVTGLATTFTSSGALKLDGMVMLQNLMNQLEGGLIPGSGAQGLS